MLSPRPEYGAAILVGRGDRIVAPRAFGRMGTLDAPAVSAGTIFLIASCTKPIVASAACLLIERGLLELNQPLHEIIPEVAEEQNGIRLIHLMTHTSGFGPIPRNQEFRATRQPLDRFVREMFKRRTFDFAPGTGVKYCNAGFAPLERSDLPRQRHAHPGFPGKGILPAPGNARLLPGPDRPGPEPNLRLRPAARAGGGSQQLEQRLLPSPGQPLGRDLLHRAGLHPVSPDAPERRRVPGSAHFQPGHGPDDDPATSSRGSPV